MGDPILQGLGGGIAGKAGHLLTLIKEKRGGQRADPVCIGPFSLLIRIEVVKSQFGAKGFRQEVDLGPGAFADGTPGRPYVYDHPGRRLLDDGIKLPVRERLDAF